MLDARDTKAVVARLDDVCPGWLVAHPDDAGWLRCYSPELYSSSYGNILDPATIPDNPTPILNPRLVAQQEAVRGLVEAAKKVPACWDASKFGNVDGKIVDEIAAALAALGEGGGG